MYEYIKEIENKYNILVEENLVLKNQIITLQNRVEEFLSILDIEEK